MITNKINPFKFLIQICYLFDVIFGFTFPLFFAAKGKSPIFVRWRIWAAPIASLRKQRRNRIRRCIRFAVTTTYRACLRLPPGNISQLIQSEATAFRVQFEGEIPPYHTLYWRGPVLWNFDGRTWKVPDFNISGSLAYSRTVTLVVRAWLAAWRQAGGDVGRTPYLEKPAPRAGPERNP